MAYAWLAMVLLLASSVSIEARRMRVRRRCQKIAVPACSGLGYQRTSFPNKFTNITTQAQTNNLTKFLPELFKLNCTTTDALPFLCSVYVPVCSVKKNVLPPCREFCTKSVGRCPALAASFGIPWPRPLDCSNYPERNSGQSCLAKLKFRKRKNEGKKCCRLGELAATTVKKCNLTSVIQKAKRPLLKLCKAHEAKYNECCLKKIQQRTNKKQERKEKKKERKDKKKAKKQGKVEKKQQRKQQKQQKRKQKQGERKQKRKDRKQKKQNKKQNKKQTKIHGRGD